MHKLLISCFGLTISLAIVSGAGIADVAKLRDKVENVFINLENFNFGLAESSGLSMADLRAAADQAKSWDAEYRLRNWLDKPELHCAGDLAFAMLESQKFSQISDEQLIARLESLYKEVIRPGCEARLSGLLFPEESNIDQVKASLMQVKGSEQLNKEMLEGLETEYMQYLAELSELEPTDDNGEEVMSAFNFVSRPDVYVLKTKIFPLLGVKDNLEELRKIFVGEMAKSGLTVDENGELKWRYQQLYNYLRKRQFALQGLDVEVLRDITGF